MDPERGGAVYFYQLPPRRHRQPRSETICGHSPPCQGSRDAPIHPVQTWRREIDGRGGVWRRTSEEDFGRDPAYLDISPHACARSPPRPLTPLHHVRARFSHGGMDIKHERTNKRKRPPAQSRRLHPPSPISKLSPSQISKPNIEQDMPTEKKCRAQSNGCRDSSWRYLR